MKKHDKDKTRILEYIYIYGSAYTYVLNLYYIYIISYFFVLLYYFISQKLALTEK